MPHALYLLHLCAMWQEIDELVDEWTPEQLTEPISQQEEAELASVPVIIGPPGPKATVAPNTTVINLASYNFTGLSVNEEIKEAAKDTLRQYGLGSCGPRGFHGNIGECPVCSSRPCSCSCLSILGHRLSTAYSSSVGSPTPLTTSVQSVS